MGPAMRARAVGATFVAIVLGFAAACSSRSPADGGERVNTRRPPVTPPPGLKATATSPLEGRPLDLGGSGWLGLRWGMSPEEAAGALGRAGVTFTREEPRVAIFATDSGPADVPMDHIYFDRDGWRVNLDFVGFRLGSVSLVRPVSGAEEADRMLRDLELLYGPPELRQDIDCHQQPLRAVWSAPGTQISVNCYVFDGGWSIGQTVETVPQTPFGP
jgi:hypothetical protein